jgi:DNA repair exonuclease SbcCD ATPase subunit
MTTPNEQPANHPSQTLDQIAREIFMEIERRALTTMGYLCAVDYMAILSALRAVEARKDGEIERLTGELNRERAAHDQIASLCFSVGGEAADGTSLSAVKSLTARVKELEAELERMKKSERLGQQLDATSVRVTKDFHDEMQNSWRTIADKDDRIERLTSENAELREDKEDLDWCDKNQAELSSLWASDSKWDVSAFVAPRYVTIGTGDNIRQAIRAARKSSARKEVE